MYEDVSVDLNRELRIGEIVDDRAASFAREHGLAGLAVGVVRDGELVRDRFADGMMSVP